MMDTDEDGIVFLHDEDVNRSGDSNCGRWSRAAMALSMMAM